MVAHGIHCYVFKESRPTPELSFKVRYLNTYARIVITASYNQKQYNGFKVYGEDGAQLIPQFADQIVAHMKEVEDILSIKALDCEGLLASEFCKEIGEKLDDAYNDGYKYLLHRNIKSFHLSILPYMVQDLSR